MLMTLDGFATFVVTNQCSLCSNLHFSRFFQHMVCFSEAVRTWSLFVQRWTGHGSENSNDVCGIVQQAYRPLGFPTFPSLLFSPFPPLSSTSLPVSHFSPFFFIFSPFSLLPSLFSFFPHFSNIFLHFHPIFRFFRRFLVKAMGLSVTPSPTLCPARHLPQASATRYGRRFLHISRHC